MPDTMRNLLGAYLDGELDQRGQKKVQAHLETCQACQAEMEELLQLSRLLRAAPQPELTPAMNFKAQLMLQLPRRTEAPLPRSNGRLLTWLAPVLVLAIWIFFQVTMGVTTLVMIAGQAGFINGAASRMASSAPEQMLWITTARATMGSILGQDGQAGLKFLNDAGLFAQSLLTMLLWQVGAAVLYWGALAVVWRTRVQTLWTSLSAG